MTRSTEDVLTQPQIEAIKATQEIIKRMAENSAKTKTIFIAVTVAMASFVKPEATLQTAIGLAVYIFISISLWHMDATYLRFERQFRSHSNAIVDGSVDLIEQWQFNPSLYKAESVISIMLNNFTTRIYRIAIYVSIPADLYVVFKVWSLG